MRSAIAVIGMAARYPGASTLQEFWENVLGRRVQFRDIPAARMGQDYLSDDPASPDTTYGKRAAVLDGFTFDAVARRVPRRTYEGTDIVHWLALEVALAAAQDAQLKLDTSEIRQQIGVVLGNTLTGEETRANALRVRWPFIGQALRTAAAQEGMAPEALTGLELRMEQVFKSVFPPVTEDTLAGGLSNTIAGRICNYLDLGGGAFTVDGACSSSLLAVTVAGDMLMSGRADVMLVGGVDVSIDPFELVGFAKATALSPDDMRVYDQRGNGFIPGEGCGFVVLKRLEDAQRDHDRIYAVIEGWGISTDGKGALTSPTISGQALALRRAYQMAGSSVQDLRFIEGHGTGTKVGDRVELCAISEAVRHFSPQVAASQIGVTSLKSIVGHTKAAAGIGGFIKAVMAVHHRIVPPMAGCERPHEVFSNEALCLYPVRSARLLARDESVHAGVSAMGFGGINCHVALMSGPTPVQAEDRAHDAHILASWQASEVFPFAADDRETLVAQLEALLGRAKGLSVAELADLAVHEGSRPLTGGLRAAVVASSPDDLASKLRQLIAAIRADVSEDFSEAALGAQTWLGAPEGTPSIGFLFSGQGSQRAELGLELFRRFPWARSLLELADKTLSAGHPSRGIPLSHILMEAGSAPALARELDHTEIAQPAICLVSMLWYHFLALVGISPSRVAGHSLGELTALWAAQAFDDETLLRLAVRRGQAMAADPEHPAGMLALFCSRDQAEQLVRETPGYCVIANYNSRQQHVVAGDCSALKALTDLAGARHINVRPLPVSNAFHSRLVEGAGEVLRHAEFLPGDVTLALPFHSGCQPGHIQTQLNVPQYLGDQVVKPVYFVDTLESIAGHTDWLIEVGPGQILSGLASQGGLKCAPVAADGSRSSLCALVAEAFCRGVEVRWSAFYENRAVRPFVPASERLFYRNPCEKLADNAPPLRTQGALSQTRGATPRIDAPSPVSASEWNADAVVDRVREIVSEQTGYPMESITRDSLLLDNLNLDSIKAIALLDEVSRTFGVRGKLPAHQLENASVAQLAAVVHAALAAATSSEPLTERVDPPWVESFVLELTPEAQGTAFADVQSFGNFAENPEAPLTRVLCEKFPQARNVVAEPTPLDATLETLLVLMPGSPGPLAQQWAQGTAFLASFGAYWKSLGEAGRGAVKRLLFVQETGRDTTTAPGVKVTAFAASFVLENPEIRVQVIDLPADASAEIAVEHIATELRASPSIPFSVACFSADGTRRVPRLRRVTAALPSSPIPWEPSDVVLVTGGGKGITAECALAFAQTTGVQFALLGRSAMPNSLEDPSELGDSLRRFAQAGVRAHYFQCDVADRAALETVLAQVESTLGPVTGVIHGAGLNRARRIEDVSRDEARDEIAPKLQGALHLCSLLETRPLKLFCALTSVIGVAGMAKNAWYAYANEQLDALLHQFQSTHPTTQVIGLAYSAWDEVGMGVKMGSLAFLAQVGMTPIPVEHGVAQFLAWTAQQTPEVQVVITSRMGDLPTWRTFRPASITRKHTFATDVTRLEPEVEAVARCTLTTERYPFLHDHDFHGSTLFPTVMGLETMAEVVQLVTGRTELLPVTIKHLELERPVIVPAKGNRIELTATRIPAPPGEEIYAVKLYSEETGYEVPHFHCEFHLKSHLDTLALADTACPTVGEPLPLSPEHDLYGHLLFQGPRFQRLESIFALDDRICTFGTQATDHDSELTLLGDPYSRDALLQSMQLVVTPEEALPVRVREWRILKRLENGARAVAHGDLVTRENDVRGGPLNAWSASDGSPLEQLVDYEAKVLRVRRDWPTPAELTQPKPMEVDPKTGIDAMRSLYGALAAASPTLDGPDGQWRLRLSDFVTFREAASISRHTNHAYFIDWMGRLREVATFPIRRQWTEDLMTGEWGLVTNSSGISYERPVTAGDLIEGSFYLRSQSGTHGATLHFGFEWNRVEDDLQTLVAHGWMDVTWVAILGPASVEPRPFPRYFNEFFRTMVPSKDRAPTPDMLRHARHSTAPIGQTLVAIPLESITGPLLYQHTVQTGQTESNLIGNVYYANYSRWQAAAIDALIKLRAPRIFRTYQPGSGELRCAQATIRHLREAMPFDRIGVDVHLRELGSQGMKLEFVFWRFHELGRSKLAVGEATAVWSLATSSGDWQPRELPDDLRTALLAELETVPPSRDSLRPPTAEFFERSS